MNEQIKETRKYLYAHTSQETAYVVDDYPWGFRLRTKIRYWIESKSAKNGGQRFVSQTVNPKTGQWCAPKPSTYSPIVVMYLDEKDHIHYDCLRIHDEAKIIQEFKETHLAFMNEFQKEALREILAYNEVMKHVTFTVSPSKHGPVSLFSQAPEDIEKRRLIAEEQEENKKAKKETEDKINRAIGYHYHKNKTLIV